MAKQLGAQHLIFHHGYVPFTTSANWVKSSVQRSVLFFDEFLSMRGTSMAIHIENVFDWDPTFLVDLIDGVAKPFVDANLDIGHVNCFAKTSIIEWINCLGNRIGYVHLHDNHGTSDEHLGLGKGKIPLEEALAALSANAPDAFWAIEADGDGRQESIDWLAAKGFL